MKITPSGCVKGLKQEFKALRELDDRNQKHFASQSAGMHLTKRQLHYLTEAVFLAAYRAFEQFLRNVFLLYCCNKQPQGRRVVRSYLDAKSLRHAEALLKSSMPFLDWGNPEMLKARAETYLKDGYPLAAHMSANMVRLNALRVVRNHIAHMSDESTRHFKGVTRAHFGTNPISLPVPGEFLLLSCRDDPSTYYLRSYMDTMERVADNVT